MKVKIFILLIFLSAIFVFGKEYIPNPKPNGLGDTYVEKDASLYPVDDVLMRLDNKEIVKSSVEFENLVKPQIRKAMQEEMYGYLPPRPKYMNFDLQESGDAFNGKAIRKQIRINMKNDGSTHCIDILVYIPKNAVKPVSCILGLNYCGNHTVVDDDKVFVPTWWQKNFNRQNIKISDHKAKASDRGAMKYRWPVEKILESGYAFATANYCQIYPDYEKQDASKDSIYRIFSNESGFSTGPATIAWAWGNCRLIDCLETLPEINKDKIALVGHSRLARTAVLTGALDKRPALILANNPGEMGGAIARRRYGENIASMNKMFPVWFSPNLKKYSDKEWELPIDLHQVIACITPRLVYFASATQDCWGDPKGELTGLVEASKAFKLYGAKSLPTMDNLKVEEPFLGDALGYHLREGRHDILDYDWQQYLKFAKKNNF